MTKEKIQPLRQISETERSENERDLMQSMAQAKRKTFADEVQSLIQEWQRTSRELDYEELSGTMRALGFSEVCT